MSVLQKELIVVVTLVYEDAVVASRFLKELSSSLGSHVYKEKVV
jgi:hypothetical protein